MLESKDIRIRMSFTTMWIVSVADTIEQCTVVVGIHGPFKR